MTKPTRFFLKTLFLIAVLAALVIGAILAAKASARLDKITDLATSSQVITTSAGPIEYSLQGTGPTVLVLHGIVGGYDQGLLTIPDLVDEGFQVLSVSRPGYLRTPLSVGQTPEEQAKALIALLDSLNLSQVAVVAWSAGGPPAVELAARYPDRVSSLILLSAVTERYQELSPTVSTIGHSLMARENSYELGAWLSAEYVQHDPREPLKRTLALGTSTSPAQRQALADYVLKNPEQLDWFKDLLGSLFPFEERLPGSRNDIAQYLALRDLPLPEVKIPTLIVHGTADAMVPYATAEHASRKLPSAQLYPVPEGGHFLQLGPQAAGVRQTIVAFLHQHSAQP